MATELFNGVVSAAVGVTQRANIPIPDMKQKDVPLELKLTFDAAAFPAEVTLVEIGLSVDGGATFRIGGMTFNKPADPVKLPFHTMTMSLGPKDTPTHMWYRMTAVKAFDIQTKLEAM